MATETTLWDISDKRPEKIIYVSSAADMVYKETLLDRQRSVQDAQEEAYELRDALKKYKLVAIDKKGNKYVPKEIQMMYSNEKKHKIDYIAFIAIIKDAKNFHLFFEEWPEPIKELLKKVVKEHFVYHADATKILGESCLQDNRKYFWEKREVIGKLGNLYRLTTGKAPVSRSNSYDQRDFYLTLAGSGMYVELLDALHHEQGQLKHCEELPHAEEYRTYSGEDKIFTILPIMSSLYDSKQLNMGKSKLPATELKKAAKIINLPEFFDDGNKLFSVNLCASFVLNIYTHYCDDWYDNELTETQDLLKDLLMNISSMDEQLLPILMPHIKGFRKVLTDFCYCGNIFANIIAVLEKYHNYGWLPIDKICYLTRIEDENTEDLYLLFNLYDFDKVSLHNDYDDKPIYLSNLLHEITRPYIKAVLFMMAAFGFVEIAYKEKPDQDATSYYDTLAYVRLTNLGLYALDIKRKYVRTKEAEIHYFELDTERLIIKSLVDNNPYESLLGNMATAISKKMHKVSYESFLNGCEKLQDINSKIDFFKEYISSQDLPDNWAQFFKDIKKRCKPMKAPKKKYSLLQIPTDDKELQHIILTDPTIRKFTLKAEGFILLVETNFKSKVVEALKKYGYLI